MATPLMCIRCVGRGWHPFHSVSTVAVLPRRFARTPPAPEADYSNESSYPRRGPHLRHAKKWAMAQTPADPLLHLMPVQVVKAPNHSPALMLPVYTGTLSDFPLNVSMAELFLTAAVSMEQAITTMHSAGMVHCEVKPANIFVTSDGECVLGDYDAAVQNGTLVTRSTVRYLSKEMAELFNSLQLMASPAVDYATLLMSLTVCLGVRIEERAVCRLHSAPGDQGTGRWLTGQETANT